MSVDAVSRGMVTFKLVKNFVKTRAAESEAYPFSNILAIDITVKKPFYSGADGDKRRSCEIHGGFYR